MNFIILLLVINILSAVGSLRWMLREKPAVFGTDIHLVCHLPNDTSCCRIYNRKWIVGFDYKIVVVNGLSLDNSKYIEELDEIGHVSILTIKAFDEKDVNIPYACAYGFLVYRAQLQLDQNLFEFHPSNVLPIVPVMNENNITLNVIFEKIYPIPVCIAVLGNKSISTYLSFTTTRCLLFYESTIRLDYYVSEEECRRRLRVNCKVGQTNLRLADSLIVCSNEHVRPPSDLANEIVIVIVISVIVLLILIISVGTRHLCYIRNLRLQQQDYEDTNRRDEYATESMNRELEDHEF